MCKYNNSSLNYISQNALDTLYYFTFETEMDRKFFLLLLYVLKKQKKVSRYSLVNIMILRNKVQQTECFFVSLHHSLVMRKSTSIFCCIYLS